MKVETTAGEVWEFPEHLIHEVLPHGDAATLVFMARGDDGERKTVEIKWPTT